MTALLTKLLTRHYRLIGIAVLCIALVIAGLRYRASLIQAGRDEVRAEWDADELAEKAVADQQAADNRAKELAATARNEVIARDYQTKLAAAAGSTDRYRRLLQQARASANSCPAEADRAVPGATPASEAGSPATAGGAFGEQLDAAIAAVMVEARQNADAYDSLLSQLKPQLPTAPP